MSCLCVLPAPIFVPLSNVLCLAFQRVCTTSYRIASLAQQTLVRLYIIVAIAIASVASVGSLVVAIVAAVLVTSVAADTATTVGGGGGAVSACARTIHVPFASQKYHTCDKEEFNERKRERTNRHTRYHSLKEHGLHRKVPNEKTVVCPATVASIKNADQVTGYDTMWAVENDAEVPIVMGWVNNHDNVEYSAMNPDIAPTQVLGVVKGRS